MEEMQEWPHSCAKEQMRAWVNPVQSIAHKNGSRLVIAKIQKVLQGELVGVGMEMGKAVTFQWKLGSEVEGGLFYYM